MSDKPFPIADAEPGTFVCTRESVGGEEWIMAWGVLATQESPPQPGYIRTRHVRTKRGDRYDSGLLDKPAGWTFGKTLVHLYEPCQ